MKNQTDHNDYKQIAFKLQGDIDFLRWEKFDTDLKFLKEMKSHAVKAFKERDVSSQEMLMKMIDDWIGELEEKLKKL